MDKDNNSNNNNRLDAQVDEVQFVPIAPTPEMDKDPDSQEAGQDSESSNQAPSTNYRQGPPTSVSHQFSYADELSLLQSENTFDLIIDETDSFINFSSDGGEEGDEDDIEEIIDYKELLKQAKEQLKDDDPEYEVKDITDKATLQDVGSPEDLIYKLGQVGYRCSPFLASQIALAVNTKTPMIRSLLLEGPPGCGKSFLGKSLARITGADFYQLTCYPGMDLQQLVEAPSSLALANALKAKQEDEDEAKLMNLGIISRVFKKSQDGPVILLVDELDKVQVGIDTFFLSPLQDAKIHLESGEVIEAKSENIVILFTKNYERPINDALLRRVQPMTLRFLEADQEREILSEYCVPQLITNLVRVADVMRYSDGAYKFTRPPAPEELLKIGKYVTQLLDWDIVDYTFVGRNIWQMIAKSEDDREVMELMLRYHPDFHDSLYPNGRQLTKEQVFAKLGREILKGIVSDPEDAFRKQAYQVEQVGLTNIGSPEEIIRKLADVKYECMPFLAMQIGLILNTPTEKVRTILLEGPPGCGKSFLAKALAKVCGADFMTLSCYSGMNTQHLIEAPSEVAIAHAMAGKDVNAKADLMNLGIISRAFLKSQNQPVVLLVDEIDKVDVAIDTFFLGPLQDGTIFCESRPPIDANLDNLLIVLTKNYERVLNDALLRRVHPIKMSYLNADLERKILSENCTQQLVENIISVVDRMRYSGGSYGFDRPPAPEELMTIGNYINKMLEWGITDFAAIGSNVWSMISKSEHDRAVLEHMMRFHPDYLDPLVMDGRSMSMDQVYAKLGRILLNGIIHDPERANRNAAWKEIET